MFGYELRASAGRRLRPAAIPYQNRKFMIQNSIFKIIFGQQPAEGACSGTNCGPPLPGGCGPHGPDGPAQPQEKPAAERMGLLSSSARAALRQRAAAGCCGFLSKPQIQNAKLKIQNYIRAQPAEGRTTRTCGTRAAGLRRPQAAARRPLARSNLTAKPAAEWTGLHKRTCRTQRCKPPPGRSCGPHGPDGPIPAKDKPATERTGLHKRTCRTQRCKPPPGRGCGPHGPDGPTQPQEKPAAERTGLLSSCARKQPSARGRLRAAGRTATEVTNKLFHLNYKRGPPIAARSIPTQNTFPQLLFRAQLPPRFPTAPQSAAARAAPRYSGRSRPAASRRK